jgi:hypothetical protein
MQDDFEDDIYERLSRATNDASPVFQQRIMIDLCILSDKFPTPVICSRGRGLVDTF